MAHSPKRLASRKPTLLRQYRDPAHAQPPSTPATAVTSRLPGGTITVLLLVFVVLALVALISLGAFRSGSDAGSSASSDVLTAAERTSKSGSSQEVQATAALLPPSLAPSGPDRAVPGAQSEPDDNTSQLGEEIGSEPRVAAAAPSSPVPPSVGTKPSPTGSAVPSGVASSTAAPAPAVASSDRTATAVRGVTGNEIRFGISAPFSGPSRELGRQMKLGIDTAFNLANDAGGVHGRQLKLISADDGYEPTRTAETMRQLYETHQVFGLVGNVGTPTAAVALPYALERKLLFFGPFTGANLLRTNPPDRYVFNYRASYAEETEAVVRYLVRVRGLRPNEIAVFAQQDAYGDAGFAGVAKALRALQGANPTPILRLNYQRNSVDLTDAVARLRAHKTPIKAVVMVATYRPAAKFIELTRSLNPTRIYTNVSFVGSTALKDELMVLGPSYADGVIVTQVVPALDGYSKTVLDYKTALAKYFPGEAPDYVSFEGYVVARILVEGLNRAGPQPNIEKVVDALENIRGLDMGLGTTINFSPSDHQGSHTVWGTQLDKTGRFNPIDLE